MNVLQFFGPKPSHQTDGRVGFLSAAIKNTDDLRGKALLPERSFLLANRKRWERAARRLN